MKKRYLFILILWIAELSNAQVNELGFFVGGSNYVGDIGPTTVLRPSALGYGLIYKYNRNPRIAYRTTLTNMRICSKDADSSNEIRQSFGNEIDKDILEFTAGIEFNFFEYNLSHWDHTHTPYFIFELAIYQYKKAVSLATSVPPEVKFNYETDRGIAIPFGIGYKAQLFDSFAFAIETRLRYTFTDDLDDSLLIKEEVLTDHPENAKFNDPDTNDWYVFTGFSIVYTFGRPPCYTSKRR